MSSLHQDRLLVEGSGPVTGTAKPLPTARGTSRRAVGDPEEKAPSSVPTQRQGKAQRTGTSSSTAAAPTAPRAKRATGAKAAALGGTLAARAKTATVKVATAKAATAKAATAKAATAARTAAVKTVANHTSGVRSARAAAAASSGRATGTAKATKASTAKPAAIKATAVSTASVPATSVKATSDKGASVTGAAAKPVAARTAAPKPAAEKPAPAVAAAPAKVAAAKPTPAKAAAAKPVTKAAAAKAPVAVAAAPKAAAAKASVATAAAPKAATAKVAAAKPAAKAATATATATKAAALATAAAPASAVKAAARPTPYKRVPATALTDLAPVADLADVADLLSAPDTADVVVVRKDIPAEPASAAKAETRVPLFLRLRPPLARRRPAMYLAAALVGAISLVPFAPEEPTAQATSTVSQSVSVAEQLGIEAGSTDVVVDAEATERLGELAVSRNARDAEQAAAAQVQAEADRIAAEAAAEAARPKAVLPVNGARLTSGFGARWGTLHAGIDLAAPMHTPEYAAMDGIVLEAGPASGFGLAVYIQHENGDVTVYGHMDEILVEAGQVVRAGDTIALLGNRGQSTGPHLHFEVHVGGIDGQKIDPLPWLRDKGIAI